MSSEREGRNTPGTGTGDHVVVTIIPAETPEIPGRLVIPDALPAMTVGELRLKIQALISSHPELQRLRLICAGALLSRDSATLREIVGEDELRSRRAVTIHLALRPGPDGPVQTRPATVPPLMTGVPRVSVPAPVGVPIAREVVQPPAPSGPPARPASTPATGQPPQAASVPGQPAPLGDEERRRAYEQLMRQQQQVHQAHQAILQQMMGQQMMGQQIVGQQVVGQPGAVFVPTPWGVQQPPLSLQDFQRHLNQQHIARHGQVGNPAQPALQTPSQSTTGNGETQQPQPPNAAAAPPPIAPLPPNPPVVLGGIPFALPGGRPSNVPMTNMHMTRPNEPLGNRRSGDEYPAATLSHAGRVQSDTIYLLSSPEGYQAILMGPPNDYRGVTLPNQPGSRGAGTWTTRTTRIRQNATIATNPDNAANAQVAQDNEIRQDRVGAPRQIGLRDLLGILIPFGGHLWLLMRLAFIALFMCWGASWTRTAVVCLGFTVLFLFQTGLMRPVQNVGEQMWAPIRQHIDQLVRDIDAQDGPGAQTDEASQAPQRQQRDQGLIRRAERSVALFLASFVPGIGESQVRAREEAERRRRRAIEEREEQARREEEERAQAEQAQGEETAPSGPDQDLGNNTPRISPSDPADMGPSPISAPAEDQLEGLRQRQPRVEEASDDDE